MGKKQKKTGDCKLCPAKSIEYTKSDIVPKWFIRGLKEGPDGGYYLNMLGGGPDDIGERGIAYFVDDEALCLTCNNETLSAWEQPAKDFYEQYLAGATGPLAYGPWFYLFCTSISWRVLTYLRRTSENWTPFNGFLANLALESWRSFMLTGDAVRLRRHTQHLLLTNPTYGQELPGLSTSFRYFNVVCLSSQSDREILGLLETAVRLYTPAQAHRVSEARNRIAQAGWGNDMLVLTFFGPFTLVGLVHTDNPERWANVGRLDVNGGTFGLANHVNFRVLLGTLTQDLNMWVRLYEEGKTAMAERYYRVTLEPVAGVLCYHSGA